MQVNYPYKNKGVAYGLWFLFLVSICGAHRFYAGRILSGVIYLCTFGFFGIGQFIDIFLLSGIIDEENLKRKALYGPQIQPQQPQQSVVVNVAGGNLDTSQKLTALTESNITSKALTSAEEIDRLILKLCSQKGSVTLSDLFIQIEVSRNILQERVDCLMAEGMLTVSNRSSDGAVIYRLG